jgi:organic radical activating enzyme
MSDTYCPLPWIGLNLLPGAAAPCCQWTGFCQDLTEFKSLNQDSVKKMFVDIRNDMLAGKHISGCEQCYSAEKVGALSRRQESIEKYGIVDIVNTKILDISFDNLCNLKCRGCASGSSHLWFNDEYKLYGKTLSGEKYLTIDTDLDIPNLEIINVSGGEPFLSKKFDSFAKNLLQGNIKNLQLSIVTNGTVPPPPNVFECMIEAKHCILNISIDGIGHMNEFFRSGANFDKCLETIEKFKNLKDLRKNKSTFINIHTTVSIYNVNLLGEIRDFFKVKFPEYNQSHRLLYWPEQLCIRNMPEDYKNLVRPFVEELGDEYKDVLNELNTKGENYFEHFLNYHHELNDLRSESLQNSNELLEEYIKKHNPTKNSKIFFIKQLNLLE